MCVPGEQGVELALPSLLEVYRRQGNAKRAVCLSSRHQVGRPQEPVSQAGGAVHGRPCSAWQPLRVPWKQGVGRALQAVLG